MKNNLLILACLATTFTQGMETVSLLGITKTSLKMTCHGTTINLLKESIFNQSNPTELTVMGSHQQKMLRKESLYHCRPTAGDTYHSYSSMSYIYEKNKDNDSASDDDTHHLYPQQTCGIGRSFNRMTLSIGEPCISNSTLPKNIGFYPPNSSSMQTITIPAELKNDFVYNARRAVPNKKDVITESVFIGDKAIQEAAKDLALCYNNALIDGLKALQFSKKTIAFPTLGADVGFPRDKAAPIAIATIFEFIQEHPQKYECINFFVKKRSDFALYKKLLMEYYKPLKAICLLYCIHQDQNSQSILSTIPLDVINYIAWLMFNN